MMRHVRLATVLSFLVGITAFAVTPDGAQGSSAPAVVSDEVAANLFGGATGTAKKNCVYQNSDTKIGTFCGNKPVPKTGKVVVLLSTSTAADLAPAPAPVPAKCGTQDVNVIGGGTEYDKTRVRCGNLKACGFYPTQLAPCGGS
jgi:hypothetical protein